MIVLHTNMEVGTLFYEDESKFPEYVGKYKIIPKVTEIVLPTKNKSLTDNITIFQIPYAATTNDAGGDTITIGIE